MRSKKEMQILEALEAAAHERGFDLIDIESAGSGRNACLRVYIDKQEGLTLDEVAAANTWIADTVESLDPYKGSYTLEVSSPGIDRPLRTMAHFEAALGEEVVLTLRGTTTAENEPPVEGFISSSGKKNKGGSPRRKYTGVIVSLNSEQQSITLEAEGRAYELKHSDIKKAKVKGRLDFENRKDS